MDEDQQLVILAGATAAVLCVQSIVILALSQSEKAHWDSEETTALVDYLFTHRSEGNSGNFRAATYDEAATHIAPFLVQSPEKTSKNVQDKMGCGTVVFLFVQNGTTLGS